MPEQSQFVIGYHSCDKDVGLKVLNGKDDLIASSNSWDWLGEGIYFWENDPSHALIYSKESSEKKQFNKIPIKIPFVLGATIQLGACLNLVESESLEILSVAYQGLKKVMQEAGEKLPENKGNNRALDCKVIQYIHQSNKVEGRKQFDTIRCAFPEGIEVYPGSAITSRLHIQICVLNKNSIKGYFLPLPIDKFNPYLKN